MADKRWKRHERAVAEALGTHRNPNNGEARSDIETPEWAIEHKLRKRVPDWLHGAVHQAVNAAESVNKRPAVVISESRRGVGTIRYVVLRFEDWIAMLEAEESWKV